MTGREEIQRMHDIAARRIQFIREIDAVPRPWSDEQMETWRASCGEWQSLTETGISPFTLQRLCRFWLDSGNTEDGK